MGALETYKTKAAALATRANSKGEVRRMVDTVEIVAGAALGGVISNNMPTIGGVPTDAGAGLLLFGIGLGMKQRDVMALGTGMLAGAAHEWGKTIDLGN